MRTIIKLMTGEGYTNLVEQRIDEKGNTVIVLETKPGKFFQSLEVDNKKVPRRFLYHGSQGGIRIIS